MDESNDSSDDDPIPLNRSYFEEEEQCFDFSDKEEEEEQSYVEIESDPSSAKRSKTETLLDRISALPDSIIVHILSFLPTTEEVIRTGSLSKRWQYLWTSVPILTFSNEDGRSVPDFVSFVDKTLNQCHHSKLKHFKVFFDYKQHFASQLNHWIRYAVGCNVEELHINLDQGCTFDLDHSFKVPDHLFTNSFLTNLALRFCIFAPNVSITWKKLKQLSIWDAKLSEDVIQNITSGSPALEILELCFCYGFHRLDITSASMRKLVLDGYYEPFKEEDDAVLEISAPNILSLDIIEELNLGKLLLLNVPSLVEANLDFIRNTATDDKEADEDMLKGLLQNLHNVNKLTVGGWCIEVLSSLELKGWSSPRSKCKCLKIEKFIRRSGFPGLANLLHSSPDLETLLINVDSPIGSECSSGFHTKGNYLTCRKRRFQCLQLHMKTVEICYFVEWDRECELVQFLLKNACVLERISINVGSAGKNQPSSLNPKLLQVTRKLLSFPRASKDAVVLFVGLLDVWS